MGRRINRVTIAKLEVTSKLKAGTFKKIGTIDNRNGFVKALSRCQKQEYKRLLGIIHIPAENIYRVFEYMNDLYIARIK